jgi:hypothetical protein
MCAISVPPVLLRESTFLAHRLLLLCALRLDFGRALSFLSETGLDEKLADDCCGITGPLLAA